MLHADPAQIGDELLGCFLGEVDPACAGRPLNCQDCSLSAQELETERCGQSRRDKRQKWIESGQVIFAEGEQGPPLLVPQCFPHLGEEFGFGLTIGRVEAFKNS